jgi:hypothetical protein
MVSRAATTALRNLPIPLSLPRLWYIFPLMGPAPSLSPSESKVSQAILGGQDVDLSSEPNTASRTIRAHVIVEACLAIPADKNASPVRLSNMIVQGPLDLSSRILACGLHWSGVEFDHPLQLQDAQLQSLKFSQCKLAGINAARVRVLRAVVFESETTCADQVVLNDAQIFGDLVIGETTFKSSKEPAIDASRLKVDGSVWFKPGTVVEGKLEFTDTIILRRLAFAGCSFRNIGRETFVGNRIQAGSNVSFANGVSSAGLFRLQLAAIGGNLEFDEARFRNAGATALNMNSINVKGSVLIRDGFESTGEISMRYGTAGGTFEISNARFENLQGIAIALHRLTVGGSLIVRGAKTQGEFGLPEARIDRGLLLEGSIFSNWRDVAFRGNGMKVGGSMVVQGGNIFQGLATMVSATIETTLSIRDTELEYPGGLCLDCYGINTGGTVTFSKGVTATGEVRISAAEIGGALVFESATVKNPTLVAVRADATAVKAEFSCKGATIEGTFRLANSRVTGPLVLDGCYFANPSGNCLDGYESRLGYIEIVNQTALTGTVSMVNAHLTGGVAVRNSGLRAPGRIALSLEAAVVPQSVFLQNAQVEGELRFIDARIEGVVELRPAMLGKSTISVNGSRMQVRGRVLLELPPITSGDIVFAGANAGHDFELTGGAVEKYGAVGINLGGLECSANVTLRRILCYSIRMPRCRIGGDLECANISFNGAERLQFWAARSTVKGVFTWRRISGLAGDFDVTDLKAGQLSDEEASWPGPGHLFISNFTYDTLDSTSPAGKERLEWLRRQARFQPQPYHQAIKAIQGNGMTRESQRIAIALRSDERKSPETPLGKRLWNRFLAATIGNGHQIWRALVWALVIIIVGGTMFKIADQQLQIVVPADTSKPAMQPFNAWAYSLDVFLPVVDLYQEKGYRLSPVAPWQNLFLVWTSFEILSGWLLTSVSLAALSGLVKKD